MSARDLAAAAFWSPLHPLNRLMVALHGEPFSLRDLIALAEKLPADLIALFSTENSRNGA